VETNVVGENQLRLIAIAGETLKTVKPDSSKPLAMLQFQIKENAPSNSVASLDFIDTTKIVASNGDELPLQWVNGGIVLNNGPDFLIKSSVEPNSSYALDNVYQSVPSGAQIESQVTTVGVKKIYQAKIENDGSSSQSF